MIDVRRFWTHVLLEDDSRDSCWIWTGAVRDDGRGRFKQDGVEMRAHWAAWEIRTGEPVPAGHRLEHTCAKPQCVRHWKLGRLYRKLDRNAISDILSSGLGDRRLAKKYGVTRNCIRECRLRHGGVLTMTGKLSSGRTYA